jgi:hypothetical protein
MAMPMVAFGAIVYYLNTTNPVGTLDDTNQVLLFIPGLILIAALPLSQMLFSKTISGIKKDYELQRKIAGFQTAHILKMALFEATGLVGAVISLLTGTSYNLIVIAVALGMFTLNQPTPEKVESALQLDSKERSLLRE